MDEDTCMVDMARFFLDFTKKESCGKCNYCRIGTKRMLEILERITKGEGKDGDIELLEELAGKIKDGAMCGLGQTAPNPVLTTLKYFRNEYEDHIYNHKCTAKSCKALIHYEITEDCKGCTACARPVCLLYTSVISAYGSWLQRKTHMSLDFHRLVKSLDLIQHFLTAFSSGKSNIRKL